MDGAPPDGSKQQRWLLQMLIRDNKANGIDSVARRNLIAKGTLFLIRNKDRYGVWYSTQTTINVLDSFLAALGDKQATANQILQIIVNGEVVQDVTVPPDKIDPAIVDLSGKLNAASNTVEVRGTGDAALMSQVVASHYVDWKNSDVSSINVGKSRALRLDYKCDKLAAAIMQEMPARSRPNALGIRDMVCCWPRSARRRERT